MTRLSKRQLQTLDSQLADRDRAVLASLHNCRYLTTAQLRRLHYTDSVTTRAGLRAANRGLAKLHEHDLTVHLKRRIGGVRAGSGSLIWLLTENGNRLLHLAATNNTLRKRFFEPSPAFLEHTLAVSEIYLQVIEISKKHGLKLNRCELEPAYARKPHFSQEPQACG